jgi:hypothetical protein
MSSLWWEKIANDFDEMPGDVSKLEPREMLKVF